MIDNNNAQEEVREPWTIEEDQEEAGQMTESSLNHEVDPSVVAACR